MERAGMGDHHVHIPPDLFKPLLDQALRGFVGLLVGKPSQTRLQTRALVDAVGAADDEGAHAVEIEQFAVFREEEVRPGIFDEHRAAAP